MINKNMEIIATTSNRFNTDIYSQINLLQQILQQNKFIQQVFARADELQLPNWYLGAGCITQTVWNYISKQEATAHIKDIDLVYFDEHDLTYEGENCALENVKALLKDIPIPIDVKNQARVHLWYDKRFGYSIKPFQSVEDAINSWPTTVTCIGVSYRHSNFLVYAPYGLHDIFGMIVRPNKVQITEEIYVNKVTRWKRCWTQLQIIPW
jgi:hypothetical protein